MRRFSFTRFQREERGGLTVEAILVLPFLLWAFVATFVFFDAYRTQGIALKAAYTISDTLSRETEEIDYDYIHGLNQVFDFLTFSPLETRLRVTVIEYIDGGETEPDRHNVVWSASSSDAVPDISDATFEELAPDIPDMGNGEEIIVVDTWVSYMPALSVGIDQTTMFNRLVTRPRFTAKLAWDEDSIDNGGAGLGSSSGGLAGVMQTLSGVDGKGGGAEADAAQGDDAGPITTGTAESANEGEGDESTSPLPAPIAFE